MGADLKAIDGGRVTRPDQRRRDLASIHMAKTQLGMDDDHYRDLLFSVTRVRSARELDHTGRQRLLEHFRKLGWKPKQKPRPNDDGAERQANLIRALWHQLLEAEGRQAEASLDAYVRRVTGCGSVRWLSTAEATKVIEGLKSWVKRAQAKQSQGAAA
ncbi:MAG: gp16 family protein [Burkholderiaceae bacterium]